MNKQLIKYSYDHPNNCIPKSATTLHDFVGQIVKVYGDGGMISFAWTLASIYNDIVYEKLKSFPILNLFGRKGSGKTELTRTLSSMFFTLPSSPNSCSNTTINVISLGSSHCANVVYIQDDFTNDLTAERIDNLNHLWSRTIHTNMKGAQQVGIEVASSVILAGQDKPEEEAIFSRCIHIMCSRTSYTSDERADFNKLTGMVSHGNIHLLPPLILLRDTFENGFAQSFELTINDVLANLGDTKVDHRLLKNWVVALAAFRVLEPHIDVPFTYNKLFETVVEGILYQNSQLRK